MTSSLVDGTLTVDQAAQRLGVSVQTVRRWIRLGRLPALRVGAKRVRVREVDLDRMVSALPVAGGETLPSREEVLALGRPAPEEIERRLAVLERLRIMREEMLAARGGVPFEDSTEIIREMREERGRQLGYP